MNKSYGGPSDDSDYVAADGLSIRGWLEKVTLLRSLDHTILVMYENWKTLHKYYEAGYIPKDVANSGDTGYDLSQDTWLVRGETVDQLTW